ncbi:hypothetical protein FIBSPDRAFT_969525 [Athelia psychrophila]|uniref:Uncharacterized protein n=1 Tax=Athelia psychrophila TaxID=1759441 RepID=A0A167TF71_9AGAM|nr:hypothetical protein FIBSPDRAFT_969525 [Fibularhizoctonia sp. CBS 109695]
MSSKAVASTTLNPRTTSYEFLGPPGALFIILAEGAPHRRYHLPSNAQGFREGGQL